MKFASIVLVLASAVEAKAIHVRLGIDGSDKKLISRKHDDENGEGEGLVLADTPADPFTQPLHLLRSDECASFTGEVEIMLDNLLSTDEGIIEKICSDSHRAKLKKVWSALERDADVSNNGKAHGGADDGGNDATPTNNTCEEALDEILLRGYHKYDIGEALQDSDACAAVVTTELSDYRTGEDKLLQVVIVMATITPDPVDYLQSQECAPLIEELEVRMKNMIRSKNTDVEITDSICSDVQRAKLVENAAIMERGIEAREAEFERAGDTPAMKCGYALSELIVKSYHERNIGKALEDCNSCHDEVSMEVKHLRSGRQKSGLEEESMQLVLLSLALAVTSTTTSCVAVRELVICDAFSYITKE